ncbi:MAG: guanylate kinase [Bacteriovoracaceae bacterium]|nr:guanylate kinase [Bacteriovoracaceae bacterium]
MKKRGNIIVIVAPSGTGKSTLIAKIRSKFPHLKWSVSCTTRAKRADEEHGKNYYFISQEDFLEKKSAGAFVEWAKVHSNYYGTLKSVVEEELNQGHILLFDLDVQGADSIKKIYHESAIVIFIEPPSVEVLKERLMNRKTEAESVILERLTNAEKELLRKHDYDFLIRNDDLNVAYQKLEKIIENMMKGLE